MKRKTCTFFLVPALALAVAMLLTWPVERLPQKVVKGKERHLVICVHGFMGHPCNCDGIAEVVSERERDVVVYKSYANWEWPLPYSLRPTLDGVEKGGLRLAAELEAFVARHPDLETVSLVGISLGGLYARYAAGILFDSHQHTIAGLTPRYFISFASPHIGTRRGHNLLFHYMIRTFGLQTGTDLVLADEGKVVKTLADADTPYYKALASFEHRVAYANLHHDDKVPFYSSAMDYEPSHSEEAAAKMGSSVIEVLDSKTPPDPPSNSDQTSEWEAPNEDEIQMVTSLRKLPWRIVQVYFDHPLASFTAHDAISNSWWIASYGHDVLSHLVDDIIDFDQL
uniref:DUF676 domain-containing protein n=1 Tax=Palpitomonas bilix TaxID=652834 RepID=A0A7S3GE09_9EUKA|mmetsp:Transcript_45196/g.116948  ORF Transcript_45196/g.116948 Transcript_45196/m.116948 type:complete len:340 (+) Transcript_45196:187-1206(+)